MPLHDLKCRDCGHIHENVVASYPNYPECEKCGGETGAYFGNWKHHILGDEIKEYWCPETDRMISSRSERKRIMRENGLTEGADLPRHKDRMAGKDNIRMI